MRLTRKKNTKRFQELHREYVSLEKKYQTLSGTTSGMRLDPYHYPDSEQLLKSSNSL
jgi:hypothetical protein